MITQNTYKHSVSTSCMIASMYFNTSYFLLCMIIMSLYCTMRTLNMRLWRIDNSTSMTITDLWQLTEIPMLPSCFGFCFVAPESITHTNNCTSQFCSILYSISTLSLIRCHYFYPTEHNVRLFFHVQETYSILFYLRILPIPSSLSRSTSITCGILATNATNTYGTCVSKLEILNTKKYDKNCAV